MSLFTRLFRPNKEEGVTFKRLVLEGRAVLDPELAKEYERVYWAERTLGKSDQEVMAYLSEDNAERGRAHLINPAAYFGGDSLH
jgi:hypothetical protein